MILTRKKKPMVILMARKTIRSKTMYSSEILTKGLRLSNKKQNLIREISEEILMFLLNKFNPEYEIDKERYIKLRDSELLLNILVTTQSGIKRINKKFRDINKPTNVLSFSYITADQELIFLIDKTILIGEIILNWEEVLSDSGPHQIELRESLLNLLSHSILHIFGFSHSDKVSLKKMEVEKFKILKDFKYKYLEPKEV